MAVSSTPIKKGRSITQMMNSVMKVLKLIGINSRALNCLSLSTRRSALKPKKINRKKKTKSIRPPRFSMLVSKMTCVMKIKRSIRNKIKTTNSLTSVLI